LRFPESSDPFFTIEVNNKAVFKSDEYDKNLNPSLTKEPILGVLLSAKELDTLKIVVADFQNIIGELSSRFLECKSLIIFRKTSAYGLCVL
jgi:Ca2+-dependent lipid-binding protein